MPRPKKPVGTHVFQKELSDCVAVRQLFGYIMIDFSSFADLLQLFTDAQKRLRIVIA